MRRKLGLSCLQVDGNRPESSKCTIEPRCGEVAAKAAFVEAGVRANDESTTVTKADRWAL